MLQISEALFLKRSNGPLRNELSLRSVQVGEPGNKAKTSPPGETTNVSPLVALGVLQHVGHAEPERLTYVTHNLRSLTSSRDQVDKDLYDFVTAKLCSRLSDLDLLQHPTVQAELKKGPLWERCASLSWYEGIIEKHAQGTKHCRLFQPLPGPPPT
eukprot:jgi/Undpi1/12811/HiC_scaffold_7.g02478.m1